MLRRLLYIVFFFHLLQPGLSQDVNRLLKSPWPMHLVADSLDLLARKYMLSSRTDSARILLDLATERALASKNPVIIARCYIDYASLCNIRSRFTESGKYLELARPYLAVIDNYDIQIAGILLQALQFNMTGRKDSAIYYYRKAEIFNLDKGAAYRNYVVYLSLGELYNQLNDLDEAERNYEKAYRLTASRPGKPDHGPVLVVCINFHLNRNRPEGAGKLITEYNTLLEEQKKSGYVDPLKNLVMGVTGNRLENNIDFMKAVRDEAVKTDETMQVIITDLYITKYYEKKKDYAAALKFITEAELLSVRSASLSQLYGTRRMKFEIQQKAGAFAEAAKTAEDLFDLKDSLLSLEKRELLYELEKKFDTEKKQKEIALMASQKELDDKTIALLTSAKKLSSLLLQQELLQNQGLARENHLMDSIVSSEKAISLSLAREKEKESALNAALGRENTLKAAELEKEKNLRRSLLGGAVLLLLAGGVILFQYRRQRSKNRLIQKQSDDLQVLMKEIHHRVKNNLQVISSLLDLQSLTITDNQASEAVKEGKNRVQSMALIHQNLYKEGNIKGIRAKEYINNLLRSLCDSYNITNDKVRLNTQIDDLNLDVDTMIPLGLVLNELVSNSLKYAFREQHNGELNIVLKKEPQHLLLKVSDNGSGYPEGMNAREGKSFGMKMIRAFAQKLKAKLDVYNQDGAVVEMHITKYQLA